MQRGPFNVHNATLVATASLLTRRRLQSTAARVLRESFRDEWGQLSAMTARMASISRAIRAMLRARTAQQANLHGKDTELAHFALRDATSTQMPQTTVLLVLWDSTVRRVV